MLLKSRASLTCFRTCFLPGRAKDLSPPRVFIFWKTYKDFSIYKVRSAQSITFSTLSGILHNCLIYIKWRGKVKCHIGDGRHIPTFHIPSGCPSPLFTVTANAILIGNVSRCKISNCRKMKNMTVVLIYRFSVCGGKADGDKLFRNSTRQSCSPDLFSQNTVYTRVSPGIDLVYGIHEPIICFSLIFWTQNYHVG